MLRRDSLLLCALAGALTLPASFALGLYTLTLDPTWQPLGLSEAAMRDGPVQRDTIVTVLALPPQTDPAAERALRAAISSSFDAFLTETRFQRREAAEAAIFYNVGGTELGPYHPASAGAGIHAAVQAQRLVRENEKPPGGTGRLPFLSR